MEVPTTDAPEDETTPASDAAQVPLKDNVPSQEEEKEHQQQEKADNETEDDDDVEVSEPRETDDDDDDDDNNNNNDDNDDDWSSEIEPPPPPPTDDAGAEDQMKKMVEQAKETNEKGVEQPTSGIQGQEESKEELNKDSNEEPGTENAMNENEQEPKLADEEEEPGQILMKEPSSTSTSSPPPKATSEAMEKVVHEAKEESYVLDKHGDVVEEQVVVETREFVGYDKDEQAADIVKAEDRTSDVSEGKIVHESKTERVVMEGGRIVEEEITIETTEFVGYEEEQELPPPPVHESTTTAPIAATPRNLESTMAMASTPTTSPSNVEIPKTPPFRNTEPPASTPPATTATPNSSKPSSVRQRAKDNKDDDNDDDNDGKRRTKIASRLTRAVNDSQYIKNRSPDLVPLAKEYDVFRKRLRSLIAATKKFLQSTRQMEQSRMEVGNDCFSRMTNFAHSPNGNDPFSPPMPFVLLALIVTFFFFLLL